jgi:hypothetical protein
MMDWSVFVALFLLAIYLFGTAAVLIIRVCDGRPIVSLKATLYVAFCWPVLVFDWAKGKRSAS